MEETRLVNLPIIGKIQLGKKEITQRGTEKLTELGHFVANVTDEYMMEFLEKYNELYENKSSIDIEIFDENPLTIKYARYNQSGLVCSRCTTSQKAYQRTKEGWKEVECSSDCIHRQKNRQGKRNCNYRAVFRFFMPSICNDRIWIMEIRGITSINRLNDYFTLQKMQGKSVKGQYKLLLKQQEIPDFTGKKYKHYVLDIVKKSNNSFSNNVSSINEVNSKLSTEKDKNVDNNGQNVNISENQNQEKKSKTNITNKQENKDTKTSNKCEKTTTEKADVVNKEGEAKSKVQQEECSLDNCYILIRTYNQEIKQKNGENKTYVMGEFYDMEDKQFNIAIKPEDAEELQMCETGTVTRLELQTINDIHFAIKLEYVEKLKKNIAA